MSVMQYCLLKAAGKENIRMQNLRKPGGWFMKKVLAAGSGFKLEQRVAIAEAYRLQSVTVQELLKARPQGSKEVDCDTIGKAFSELYESEADGAALKRWASTAWEKHVKLTGSGRQRVKRENGSEEEQQILSFELDGRLLVQSVPMLLKYKRLCQAMGLTPKEEQKEKPPPAKKQKFDKDLKKQVVDLTLTSSEEEVDEEEDDETIDFTTKDRRVLEFLLKREKERVWNTGSA